MVAFGYVVCVRVCVDVLLSKAVHFLDMSNIQTVFNIHH